MQNQSQPVSVLKQRNAYRASSARQSTAIFLASRVHRRSRSKGAFSSRLSNETLFIDVQKLIVHDFSTARKTTSKNFEKEQRERKRGVEKDEAETGRRGSRSNGYRRSVAWARLRLFPSRASARIVSDRRDLYSPPRADHFFSRLGSLSVATIVIKSRVNEPH